MVRVFKSIVGIVVITALLCISSLIFAQTKTIQGKTATVTSSKILVTKQSKVVTLTQPVSSQSVVAPKLLTREEKQAYAREMLLGLGVKKVELPPSVTKVKLTPDTPRSGLNWYEIYFGHNFPNPGNDPTSHTRIFRAYYNHRSKMRLHFERTIPNKLYMLDITASSVGGRPDRELIFSGAVEGGSRVQNGHVVVGFIATQAVSEIEFQLDSGEMGDVLVYSIELTQVD